MEFLNPAERLPVPTPGVENIRHFWRPYNHATGEVGEQSKLVAPYDSRQVIPNLPAEADGFVIGADFIFTVVQGRAEEREEQELRNPAIFIPDNRFRRVSLAEIRINNPLLFENMGLSMALDGLIEVLRLRSGSLIAYHPDKVVIVSTQPPSSATRERP